MPPLLLLLIRGRKHDYLLRLVLLAAANTATLMLPASALTPPSVAISRMPRYFERHAEARHLGAMAPSMFSRALSFSFSPLLYYYFLAFST